MDDLLFGRAIRLVRVKRRWRQEDLAIRAGVSRAAIWRVERGRIDELTIAMLRRICEPLEIRVELLPRGRGTDLERLVNARHGALHESVARALASRFPAWEFAPEVSFNIYGERGVVDLILWHPGLRALLIIEFKTELVDTGDLLSTMDRRRRLALDIVAGRGWKPLTVSTWVVVARSRTNERRIADHQAVLRSAFPNDERDVMRWLADPEGTVNGLSMWRSPRGASFAPTHRVRRAASG